MFKRIWAAGALVAFLVAGSAAAQLRNVGDWAFTPAVDPITDENVSYASSSEYAEWSHYYLTGDRLHLQCAPDVGGLVVHTRIPYRIVPGTEFEAVYRADAREPRSSVWFSPPRTEFWAGERTLRLASTDVDEFLRELSSAGSVFIRFLTPSVGAIDLGPIVVQGTSEVLANLSCYQGPAGVGVQQDVSVGLEERIAEFGAADAALNEAYQLARELLPEELFVELRDSQRTWLEHRDARAGRLGRMYRGAFDVEAATEDWPEFWEARTNVTAARTDYLLGWAREYDGTFADHGPWEGVWVDSYGGRLEVLDPGDDELVFHLEVARGASGSMGDISGLAVEGEGVARFQVSVPTSSESAEILMTRSGPTLVLESSGPVDYYHGAQAYFDGVYARFEALSPEQRVELFDMAPGDTDR